MAKNSPLPRPRLRLSLVLTVLAIFLVPGGAGLAAGDPAPPADSTELITPAFVPSTMDDPEPQPLPDAGDDELRPRRIENSYCHTAMGVTACYWSEGSICWGTGCYVDL